MKYISRSRLKCLVITLVLIASALSTPLFAEDEDVPPVKHSAQGEHVTSSDGSITLTNVGKKQSYNAKERSTLDRDIVSPKSVNFHPDGTRYYVNSLEGGRTVVYDVATGRKLKVIKHNFKSGTGPLWNSPSPYYRFTHYPDGQQRAFMGKPVESTFSHGGRYLWVPYYRRTFDINAQDPSAIAIIDTQGDSIVRMMETGPLPKMVVCSNDNRLLAITHWGNNTVGFIDISDPDPHNWRHQAPVAVGQELELNFSLTERVDRDEESGLKLRGTVFTPDDRYLLTGCMGGGGIAVIDMQSRRYVGKIGGISNARHLVVSHGYLYASVNVAGQVHRVPLDSITRAIEHRSGTSIKVGGWQMCQVGGGARTIELSPSGNYLFAACNSASALYVVDTRTMKVIATITVDSYPVGLHLSKDGQFLVTTSQGRKGHGGNAVNLFKVTYADPQAEQPAPAATDEAQEEQDKEAKAEEKQSVFNFEPWMWPTTAGAIALLLILALLWAKKRR